MGQMVFLALKSDVDEITKFAKNQNKQRSHYKLRNISCQNQYSERH